MPRLSEETRRSLRRLSGEGSDWARTMLDLYDGPRVSPEVFESPMAEIDRVTNTMPADAPRRWRVSRRIGLFDRDTDRRIDIQPGTMLRYDHRGLRQAFRDVGCQQSVAHRFRVVDGSEAGREVQYVERWDSESDDCSGLRCTSPFPPDGLEPIEPSQRSDSLDRPDLRRHGGDIGF